MSRECQFGSWHVIEKIGVGRPENKTGRLQHLDARDTVMVTIIARATPRRQPAGVTLQKSGVATLPTVTRRTLCAAGDHQLLQARHLVVSERHDLQPSLHVCERVQRMEVVEFGA
jgi:hypothetical protein